MNHFVTHCDINFLKYAERLFETLSLFSTNKIIFYTVDFNYKSKFNNVVPIKINSKSYLQDFINYSKHSSKEDATKAYNVFLKPFIVKDLLSNELDSNNNYCYLDSDCLAINDCDRIFDKSCLITDYPLFNRGCHEFMMFDDRGNPFINDVRDLNYCLEADLMKLLNIDINHILISTHPTLSYLKEKNIFCGESMFSKKNDASKIAFYYLVKKI